MVQKAIKLPHTRSIRNQKSRDFDLGFFDANLSCGCATVGSLYATKTLPRYVCSQGLCDFCGNIV